MLALNHRRVTRRPSKPKTFSGSATALLGRVTAQAVSRRLPTAAALVQAQVRSCVVSGGENGNGAILLQVLQFLLPILIPPTASQSYLSSGTGKIGQLVTDVPSGLSLTHPKKLKKKKRFYCK
jgi:hypothetical protein